MNVMAPRPVHRKERLRIGLLGCGRIALRHGELLGKRQIDDACLAAVCDIQPERAAAFAQKHDVPAFDSLEAMLAGADLDAVAVLTPSGMHADHAVSILRARIHAIVEKPMALTLADADRMVAAAHEANRHLLVVKQNRFNVPVVKAREALDAGRFGQLVLGRCACAGAATKILRPGWMAWHVGHGWWRGRQPGQPPCGHAAVVHGTGAERACEIAAGAGGH